MAVKKVNLAQIPEEKRKELEGLIGEKQKEYVAIGMNIYELYPLPALTLLGVLTQINEILMATREYKQRTYQPILEQLYTKKKQLENELEQATGEDREEIEKRLEKTKADIRMYENLMDNIRLDDVFALEDNRKKAIDILKEILEGVEQSDLDNMTIEQLMDLVVKIVKLNFGNAQETAEAIKQVAEQSQKEGETANPLPTTAG